MAKKKHGGGGGGGGHDGGGSMRWLLTYADMITLLVAFFVMLYSMSVMDQKKFQAVAQAMRMTFGGSKVGTVPSGEAVIVPSSGLSSASFGPGMPNGPTVSGQKTGKTDDLSILAGELQRMAKKYKLESMMTVFLGKDGVVIRIGTDGPLSTKSKDKPSRGDATAAGVAMFDVGRSAIRKEAMPLLSSLGALLAAIPYDVRVEGHTCNLPVRSAMFPSNWELSSARASAVVRLLISSGVTPERCSAAGYADSQPLARGDTEEDRRMNRRVDIIIRKSERQEYWENAAMTVFR
ncbi:MAG: flagellar motor protein MotB [Deltaproteobacteria bacterium]|nr:flagellar motor protein MotB [Deltaproteobacteria bacterium]